MDKIYYILFPKDTEDDCIKDVNQLGTLSIKKKYVNGRFIFYKQHIFTKNDGFKVLEALINTRPELLEKIRIIDSAGTHLTIEKFLTKLEYCCEII